MTHNLSLQEMAGKTASSVSSAWNHMMLSGNKRLGSHMALSMDPCLPCEFHRHDLKLISAWPPNYFMVPNPTLNEAMH